MPAIALAAIQALGCGDDSAPTPSTTATTSDTGTGGAAPVVDPSSFDCTATSAPERTTKVPVTCATDGACTDKLVSGHRGVGGELGVIAPEDTRAAVRAAIVLGIDFVETDPRPTKDGHLVNLHDPEVDRTTNGTGDASTLTLAEIQALTLEHPDYPGDFSCERVPTLEEILLEAKGKIHVLIDANKTDRVDLLVAAVQTTDTLDWAIFDTDSVEKIDQALALEPSLYTMVRVADEAELDTELAHFAAHPPVIAEVHSGGSPSELAPAIHAAGLHPLVDTFVTDLAAGLDGDPSHYAEIYDAGVDIAQSDRPDLVLRYLGKL